jgi:enterochelin esterase-like enzyme
MERADGPEWDADTLTFRLPDPARRHRAVRLLQWVGIPGEHTWFSREGTDWVLRVPAPPAARVEYLLEVQHADGGAQSACDPGNPRRVPGVFGDKSVVERPGYAPPRWLSDVDGAATWRDVEFRSHVGPVRGRIRSPEAPTGHVLVAHDGPEYDTYASLGRYSGSGLVPPHHLVLLAPGDRNEWYSASPVYARTLAADLLPAIATAVGSDERPVGMGASLGALAMLHAHLRQPGRFAALFLQSGSFFLPRYDRQESRFPRYLRIVRFAGALVRDRRPAPESVPIALTTGTAEENRHNNREIAEALRAQGHDAVLTEVPDAHNFIGWRDAFDPALTVLLREVWG